MKEQKDDRRSRRTRKLITTAILELMREKRYDAIAVQDLLDRSGIGRSTFYAHFDNKDDALAAMMAEQLPHWGMGKDILPSLELFRHLSEQPEEHAQLFRTMRSHAGDPMWEAATALLSKNTEEALVAACAGKGPPSVPLPLVAEYLAGALKHLLTWWVAAEMPYTPEEMDRFFKQLALPGVRAIIEGTSRAS